MAWRLRSSGSSSGARLSDERLHALLAGDPDAGWRAFIDGYTPVLLGLLERYGLVDRDEAMEVYVLVCQRLAADDCAALRRHDAAKGSFASWLSVVVRRTIVDWVRQRAGRRRLFGSIEALDAFHQEVFQLYFWDERPPSEICEEVAVRLQRPVSLADVLDALERIHETLSQRQRAELLSAAMRARPPVSLDADSGPGAIDIADAHPGPQDALAARESARAFDRALAALPHEDAAIIRLRFVNALPLRDIQRALHLPELTERRIRDILDALRAQLASAVDLQALDRRAAAGDGG